MDTTNEVNLILEKYCEWMNMWTKIDPPSHHIYKPEQFLVTDPEKHLYGWTEVRADCISYYRIMVLETTDGDDGGSSTLVAWISGWEEDRYEPEVVYLVQEFDTYVQPIYNTTDQPKGFLNTPKDKGFNMTKEA